MSVSAWHHYTNSLPDVAAAWLTTAKRFSSSVAITDSSGAALTHRRVATAVLLLARAIKRHTPAANVGVLLPTSSAGVIANLAVLNTGKTTVNLNYTASISVIKSAIASAEIDTVITSRKFLERLATRGIQLNVLASDLTFLVLEDVMATPSKLTKFLTMTLFTLTPLPILLRFFHHRSPIDAPAAILFSSGSEGEPKGVVLSHKNIMSNVRQVSDVLNTESEDIVMATLPLFYAFGLTVTTFMPMTEGIPLVTHPDPTDSVNIGKTVARHSATIMFGTSTFFRLYTKNSRVLPLMFESLRIVVAGAERLSSNVRDAFKLKFNKDILENYGATETTPVASVNVPDALDIRSWKVQRGVKHGTVGMPLPGTSFRIVDPDTLEPLPAEQDGLILIGGNQVMLGYLNDPAKTADAIIRLDGLRWYRTGDKGRIDKDGFLTIVDRYSRFAKIGGEMISLTSVEEAVRSVLDSPELQCVAVAIPDTKKGESIVLLINSSEIEGDETEDLTKRLIAQGLSPLMTPARIELVDKIPSLASGKTDFLSARKFALQVTAQ